MEKNNLDYKILFFSFDDSFIDKNKIRLIKIFYKDVALDIFFKYIYQNKMYWEAYNRLNSLPLKEDFLQKEYILFDNKSYMVPKEYKLYLTYKYGDWRVQKSNWCEAESVQ